MNDVAHLNAAAAGRLVVLMLLLANAAAYFANHSQYAVAGMVLAIGAAACGYFACSARAFSDDDAAGQAQTLASIALSVLSGLAFLVAA